MDAAQLAAATSRTGTYATTASTGPRPGIYPALTPRSDPKNRIANPSVEPGQPHGSTVSIGALLAQTRRVLGRSPTVAMVPSGRAAKQGSALAFRSAVWPDMTHFALTPLPVGIHRTSEHLRRRLQLGTLPS